MNLDRSHFELAHDSPLHCESEDNAYRRQLRTFCHSSHDLYCNGRHGHQSRTLRGITIKGSLTDFDLSKLRKKHTCGRTHRNQSQILQHSPQDSLNAAHTVVGSALNKFIVYVNYHEERLACGFLPRRPHTSVTRPPQ